jgi:hypothetical protein
VNSRAQREFAGFGGDTLTEFVCNPENAKYRPRDRRTGSFRETTHAEDLLEKPEPGDKVGSLGPVRETSMGSAGSQAISTPLSPFDSAARLMVFPGPSDGCLQPIVPIVFWGLGDGQT